MHYDNHVNNDDDINYDNDINWDNRINYDNGMDIEDIFTTTKSLRIITLSPNGWLQLFYETL